MGRMHPSTPMERAQWTAIMLAHQSDYGIVTQLSRQHQVSRPTLYACREMAQAALLHTSGQHPAPALPPLPGRQALTLWITHASERGIQHAVAEVLHRGLSLDTISAMLAEAGRRAQTWMQTHVPQSV